MCAKPLDPSATPDRRSQILGAAMACFARKGLHQTTMQDISEQAGISVGLIYRYFESKEQVIATMAEEHLATVERKLAEARSVPRLGDALEHVLWCDHDAEIAAPFVLDLFAEAARNAHVRSLVRQVHDAVLAGVTDLIAASPDAARLPRGITAGIAAEMVFQAMHGRLFDEVVAPDGRAAADPKAQRVIVLRRMLALLLETPAVAGTGESHVS